MSARDHSSIIVGYLMKPSREQQLADLQLLQSFEGEMVFRRLNYNQSLRSQEPFHVILHKASDELMYDKDGLPCFSSNVEVLREYVAQNPDVCCVDPLECTSKVVDRTALGEVLTRVERKLADIRVRGPRYCVVQDLQDPQVLDQLLTAGLSPPFIVKPQVACGTIDSHQMALVRHPGAVSQLTLPTPALIQEFVNHNGLVHKVYVLGNKVFSALRPSIPNVSCSTSLDSAVIMFDSLKSLPTQLPDEFSPPSGPSQLEVPPACSTLPNEVQLSVAECLREELGLTLFGFDIVQSVDTGEYLVVDVNYFPNYKGGPPETPRWFRDALAATYHEHRKRREARGAESTAS